MYKSIEECKKQIKKECNIITITWMANISLYNAIAKFVIYINVFIGIILTALCCMQVIPIFITILSYVLFVSIQAIVSHFSRITMDKDYRTSKMIMAANIFSNYEKYESLENWEREKIFKDDITPATGLYYDDKE